MNAVASVDQTLAQLRAQRWCIGTATLEALALAALASLSPGVQSQPVNLHS